MFEYICKIRKNKSSKTIYCNWIVDKIYLMTVIHICKKMVWLFLSVCKSAHRFSLFLCICIAAWDLIINKGVCYFIKALTSYKSMWLFQPRTWIFLDFCRNILAWGGLCVCLCLLLFLLYFVLWSMMFDMRLADIGWIVDYHYIHLSSFFFFLFSLLIIISY
jgi:hypothetical protein